MSKLTHNLVLMLWRKIISLSNNNPQLWVAYSGGEDSRVLLELCALGLKPQWQEILQQDLFCSKYLPFPKYTLHAVHINHALQANSDLWAQHCQTICDNLNIPLEVIKVQVELGAGDSLEAAARKARREAWQSLLPEGSHLLLAHHQNDQVETVLHRLFRGAGPSGLAGMAEKTALGLSFIIRPLLQISKAEIHEYAVANLSNLDWIQNPSNLDIKFDRNFIRHKILPVIQQRWAKVNTNISRSAELCYEHNMLIAPSLASLEENQNTLNIDKLLGLDPTYCNLVIRQWLQSKGELVPSRKQLNVIRENLLLAAVDTEPEIKIANYFLRRYRNKLHLFKHKAPVAETITIEWNIKLENNLILPNNIKLSYQELVNYGIKIPPNTTYIQVILGKTKGKTAKKIFQSHAIPPWDRGSYPQLFIDNKLIAIFGLKVLQ